MDAIADLKRKLFRTNVSAFRTLTFDHAPIGNEIEALKRWVSATASETPASDLIREALLRFSRSLRLPGLRDAQLVCYGCIERFGQDKIRLIEDAQLFPKLLVSVEEYRPKPRAFRRCYKGLLSGYFGYDPNAPSVERAGKNNWERLRRHLYERLRDIDSSGIEPEWVGAVSEHRNLLTEHAYSRYGLSLLEGDPREFEEVKRKLDISDASWVVTQLILGQIESAASQSDTKFTHYLPRLLDLLADHRIVLDSGLSKVLERYVKLDGLPIDNTLRDFAVTYWGNPWLSSNSARWGRVSEPARKMVADWLKLDLIRQFFSLLSEDGANDKRRLKFWERYHKNIDDMHFALGSHARTNQSRDFVDLRKKMVGRVSDLNAGGAAQNNAFIFRMGNYVAVEFGVKGNACFIFQRKNLPFDLEQDSIAGDKSELKHDSNIRRLLHIDSNAGPWERNFEQTLGELMGARPAHATDRSSMAEPAFRRTTPGIQRTNPAPYSRSKLEAICRSRGLTIRDFTAQRGNLWVLTDQSDPSLSRQLKEWEFTYKSGKGWWREKP
jgi:hypothetical protein